MNTWVTKRFEYPSQPIERGKIVWEDKLEELRIGDATKTSTAMAFLTAP
jgi:hypothetical protein